MKSLCTVYFVLPVLFFWSGTNQRNAIYVFIVKILTQKTYRMIKVPWQSTVRSEGKRENSNFTLDISLKQMLNKFSWFVQKCEHDGFLKVFFVSAFHFHWKLAHVYFRRCAWLLCIAIHISIDYSAQYSFVVYSNCVWLISVPFFYILHNIFCYRFIRLHGSMCMEIVCAYAWWLYFYLLHFCFVRVLLDLVTLQLKQKLINSSLIFPFSCSIFCTNFHHMFFVLFM